jgi:hypothetical protein
MATSLSSLLIILLYVWQVGSILGFVYLASDCGGRDGGGGDHSNGNKIVLFFTFFLFPFRSCKVFKYLASLQ